MPEFDLIIRGHLRLSIPRPPPRATIPAVLNYDPDAAVAHLRRADSTLARVIDSVGPFALEPRDGAYRSLARAIFFQQLAGPAARAIMNRVLEALNTDEQRFFAPQGLLAATDEQFRSAGLSRQKLAYLRDLSEKFASGQLSEGEFTDPDDEEVIRRVSAVKGIGRWSAAYGLMRHLGHIDALPVGDAGLRSALREEFKLAETPDVAEQERLMEPFRPYRGLATYCLWKALGQSRQE